MKTITCAECATPKSPSEIVKTARTSEGWVATIKSVCIEDARKIAAATTRTWSGPTFAPAGAFS